MAERVLCGKKRRDKMRGDSGQKRGINAIRRENKRHSVLLKRKFFRHEVNFVFNTFYKKQVEALYRQISR